MDDRVVLVTGASSGIGEATARALSERGARLLVHGRDRARTAAVARGTGGTALLADLTQAPAVRRLAADALAVHGRVDAVVANAGAGLCAPFTDTDPDDLTRILDLDLVAPVQLVRALLPGMLERDEGHLVLVGSVAGRTGVAGEAVYAAAKAGLDAFAESLRLELSGTGVGITSVLPGVVDTPFFAARGGAPPRRFPRPVRPEVVGDAVAQAIADGRAELWVPRWLRVAPAVRAAAPGLFRRLSARYGEQVRIGPRADGRP